MSFSQELVLVTGSSRGIGKAIAYAFLKQGATVILNSGNTKDRLLETYEAFRSEGLDCSYYFGDLSDFDVATDLFTTIQKEHGRHPSIIINNAGVSHVGLFTDTPPTVWQKLLQTNLNTAYHCCYLGTPSMVTAKKGCIINISSIWGLCGASCEVAYSTSKSALNGFTKALAKELGPSRVRVNAIACGWIDTEMNAHFSPEEKEAFIDEIPLCRAGSPEDVANTCLYLASDASAYMTGQVLTLDGGLL
ncbi:MAG: elongation factor P 5-aminopentanone reductase [Cellulosilyticaceae bacterium]